jgi:hypothetical protein
VFIIKLPNLTKKKKNITALFFYLINTILFYSVA